VGLGRGGFSQSEKKRSHDKKDRGGGFGKPKGETVTAESMGGKLFFLSTCVGGSLCARGYALFRDRRWIQRISKTQSLGRGGKRPVYGGGPRGPLRRVELTTTEQSPTSKHFRVEKRGGGKSRRESDHQHVWVRRSKATS